MGTKQTTKETTDNNQKSTKNNYNFGYGVNGIQSLTKMIFDAQNHVLQSINDKSQEVAKVTGENIQLMQEYVSDVTNIGGQIVDNNIKNSQASQEKAVDAMQKVCEKPFDMKTKDIVTNHAMEQFQSNIAQLNSNFLKICNTQNKWNQKMFERAVK